MDFESEVVFNGVPIAQSETQGFQTIWNPPFEQVSEFNMLRSSFSAQYGLAQGVITYQTKSGTNQYHGDGFEILRNNFFDARGAYNHTTPIDKENNYGFGFGGFLIGIFFLFLFFGLIRAAFGFGRWGGHRGPGGYSRWGGHHDGPRDYLDAWHRERHGEAPEAPTPDKT